MAILVNEEKMINENIFKFEERLNSPVARFIDKTPVFVTYYHINTDESTVDGGFKDVEELIGETSPVKFQKITGFPLYGLDQVLPMLSDTDQGLDSTYEGDAIILPTTIKPLSNDYFTIDHVKDSYVFRVTQVDYDNIRPDNFYKINFKLEYIDDKVVEDLQNQVHEKYQCTLGDVGTEKQCILLEDYQIQLNGIYKMYDEMAELYKATFYSERYNCFIGPYIGQKGKKLFDPLQSVFINKHQLFNKRNNFMTLVLSTEFKDPRRDFKYGKSVYGFLEKQNVEEMKRFFYTTFIGTNNTETSFYKWSDTTIEVVDIPSQYCPAQFPAMFGDWFISMVKDNKKADNRYQDLLKKFIRREITGIYDIDLQINNDLFLNDESEELFFYVPILMYIIKKTTDDFLKVKKK